MKILAGVYRRDTGRVNLKGSPVNITSTGAAQRLGISMVHQELNLAPHLTVAQNIFLGREPRRRLPFVLDDRILNDKAAELFEALRKIAPDAPEPAITVADAARALGEWRRGAATSIGLPVDHRPVERGQSRVAVVPEGDRRPQRRQDALDHVCGSH